MQLLEDHIRREGKVAPGNVLRVDGFLNHQIDVVLLTKLAEEFHTRFSGEKVDKILTIEASGIATVNASHDVVDKRGKLLRGLGYGLAKRLNVEEIGA